MLAQQHHQQHLRMTLKKKQNKTNFTKLGLSIHILIIVLPPDSWLGLEFVSSNEMTRPTAF